MGFYRATVVANNDPDNKGRVRLLIPALFGQQPTNWALPMTEGFTTLKPPTVGASVWATFEGEDCTYPLYMSDGVGGGGGVVGTDMLLLENFTEFEIPDSGDEVNLGLTILDTATRRRFGDDVGDISGVPDTQPHRADFVGTGGAIRVNTSGMYSLGWTLGLGISGTTGGAFNTIFQIRGQLSADVVAWNSSDPMDYSYAGSPWSMLARSVDFRLYDPTYWQDTLNLPPIYIPAGKGIAPSYTAVTIQRISGTNPDPCTFNAYGTLTLTAHS